MRLRPRYRAAWLAILALLLPIIVPALHHPASLALGQVLPTATQNLCIAGGSGAGLPVDKDRPSHHHVPACAICQAMHAIGGFAPPALLTIARPSATGMALPLRHVASRLLGCGHFLPPPRGPPSSA